MTVRDDEVIIVEKLDGSRVVDHADGTRITTFYQDCEEHPVAQDSKKTGKNKRGIFIFVLSRDRDNCQNILLKGFCSF